MRKIIPGSKRPGIIFLYVSAMLVMICGCATIRGPEERTQSAQSVAVGAGFKRSYVETGDFKLLTYRKLTKPGASVRIYIEGDGKAWESRRILSDDPTPENPIALYLATEDPHENVAYIARPGQFLPPDFPQCDPTYWSQKRFSPEVVEAIDKAVDRVKHDAGASKVELVGYSGGGALAVLVAAKRDDVAGIITVAGNLDHKALCKHHHVSPLEGSLNPIDHAASVKNIPQRHFAGSRDSVVPAFIAYSFIDSQGAGKKDRVIVVHGPTHTKGWQERWKELLSLYP